MEQPKETLSQQVQVQEKTETMQKVVLGVGMLCAFFTLINFAAVFGVGAKNLAEQLAEQDLNWNNVAITNVSDDTRDNAVRLTLNHEINTLESYNSEQDDVVLLAFDLTNNTNNNLTLTQINLTAFVNGGYGTSTPTSTMYYTPGYNSLDGGAFYTQIIYNTKLYQYLNGQYVFLSTSTATTTPAGLVNFNNLLLDLPGINSTTTPTSSAVTTLVLKGDVWPFAPNGQFPDWIAYDITDCQNNIFIYNQDQRVRVGPNKINSGATPIVYHQIHDIILPPPDWFELLNITSNSIGLYYGYAPYSLTLAHVDGFKVWRSTNPESFPLESLIVFPNPPSINTYYNYGLLPQTHYYYKFVSYNTAGDSPALYDDAITNYNISE